MDYLEVIDAVANQTDGWRNTLADNWDCFVGQGGQYIPLLKILASSHGGGGGDLNDALATDIEFAGEAPHQVIIEPSTTTNTAGGALTVRGGNGVVVVTTKKGTKDRISVTINSGVTSEKPFVLPALQNSYGQGNSGVITTNTAGRSTSGKSSGAPLDGR